MGEEKEIGVISLAFVSGIAAATILCRPELLSLISSILSGLFLTVFALKEGRCPILALLLFMSLGIMCQATHSLTGAYFKPDGLIAEASGDALSAFNEAIRKCHFSNDRTETLITALLTGNRKGLSKETISSFRNSGASHILALSGLHLGVIYTILTKSLSFMGNSPVAKGMTRTAIVSCCGFYTLMTGASASTRRAFFFILANELSRSRSGRSHNPKCTFCLAMILQLALRPSDISSAGFQLSYLAMLGILTLFPELESWYPTTGKYLNDKIDIPRKIWSSMALSISCQIFTAPLAWWRFHSIPGHFLLTNLIALPLTEGLITIAVTAIALTALDICPGILIELTDRTADLLMFCMEVISSSQSP